MAGEDHNPFIEPITAKTDLFFLFLILILFFLFVTVLKVALKIIYDVSAILLQFVHDVYAPALTCFRCVGMRLIYIVGSALIIQSMALSVVYIADCVWEAWLCILNSTTEILRFIFGVGRQAA